MEIHFWQLTKGIFMSPLGQPHNNWKRYKNSHAFQSSGKFSINMRTLTEQHIKL